MYSSHDHDRKTHIAIDDIVSLCGIEKRFPWSLGMPYYNIEEQFLIDDPDHRNGCLRCRKIYLALTTGQQGEEAE